jgi:ribonuclease E
MTRKRIGAGLLEVFSEPCDHCNGRGVVINMDGQKGGKHKHRNHDQVLEYGQFDAPSADESDSAKTPENSDDSAGASESADLSQG